MLGVPGQYESVALMLSHKMDFNCCANRDGFRKSSHICIPTHTHMQNKTKERKSAAYGAAYIASYTQSLAMPWIPVYIATCMYTESVQENFPESEVSALWEDWIHTHTYVPTTCRCVKYTYFVTSLIYIDCNNYEHNTTISQKLHIRS